MRPAVQAATRARDAISDIGQEASACSSLINSAISAAYTFGHVNTDYVKSAIPAIKEAEFTVHRGTVSERVPRAANIIGDFWDGVYQDAAWLELSNNSAVVTYDMSHIPFWQNAPPWRWQSQIERIAAALLTLDPTYQVWIDWYNRRIEGHDAAFDIPGDNDRTHDKAILARLADATDEDFWGKGATYVNTTLQSWIDEARIDARIEEILGKLRGGATAHYGAPEEMAGRAALLDELDRLLGKSWQARHGIGGNYPPEPIDPPPQPTALPQELREPLEAISTELEKREPDALVVVEKVKLLHRVVRKLEKMADIASDEFAKSVGGELGKLVVKGVFWLAVINQILDWLTPLIRISG